MSELRKDPIIGRWVIIAPERGIQSLTIETNKDEIQDKSSCPFCKENEKKTPREIFSIKSSTSNNWNVRVIPNRFPALRVEGTLDRQGSGLYDKLNGIGAHEIIIETPDHESDIIDKDLNHIKDIFITYKRRILDLKNDHRIKYVMIFKNHNIDNGTSVNHSHSQLIATPVIPKRVSEELKGAKKYYDYKERCIFCDIVYQELKENKRIVAEEENFIAIEPFAARFPFETWIIPKNHSSNFENCLDENLHHLAILFKAVMQKINKALNNPAYHYLIHSSPLGMENIEHYHWHIEIIPKLQNVAGFEWGTGFYINPTSPEEAAK